METDLRHVPRMQMQKNMIHVVISFLMRTRESHSNVGIGSIIKFIKVKRSGRGQ